MFCSKCGSKNTDVAQYCFNCGERLNTQIINVQQEIIVNPPPPPNTAFGTFWGLVLFFIVLPIGSCMACSVVGAAETNKDGTGLIYFGLYGIIAIIFVSLVINRPPKKPNNKEPFT